MLHILLVDTNQPVVQDERFTFTRINPSDAALGYVCGQVADAATRSPPYDLISLAHGGGSMGFALTSAIPP